MGTSTAEGLPSTLRGNYAAARPDYTLPQAMADYGEADHATWRTLAAPLAPPVRPLSPSTI